MTSDRAPAVWDIRYRVRGSSRGAMDPVIDWSEFVQARRMSDAVRMIEDSYGFEQIISATQVASSVLRCESAQ